MTATGGTPRLAPIWRRYPHFIGFVAVMLATTLAFLPRLSPARSLLTGFDAGAFAFLTVLAWRFRDSEPKSMRRRAAENEPDQNSFALLAFVIIAMVMTAVGVELLGSKGHDTVGILLAAVTLAFAWLFANTLFTLHYAHAWYLGDEHGKDRGGLDFPGPDTSPDYWDFAYFAFVLGMTFQVSDVVISSKRLRRLALLHAMLAFLFNIGVVALSVSIVAAVLGG